MPAGRPSKYDKDVHPAWAWGLAVQGATEAEIATKFGVSVQTLISWKEKHPEFLESIKTGKEPTDATVEQSLFKRACGYTYSETRKIAVMGKDGKPLPARVETVERHIPPDTAAAFIWLKNRRPDLWRDRREFSVEANGDANNTIDELERLIAKRRVKNGDE